MGFLNDWENDLDADAIKKQKDYNLETLYEHTHSELSLQQSKRDQIITTYLALFSFLIPFSLSLGSVATWMKGLIFLVVGMIGILFSFINVRYRVYKEIYWISCQTITVLMNLEKEKLSKKAIQRAFFYSLKKKGNAYLEKRGEERVWNRRRFIKKNLYSAETFHHMIEVLITAAILALSCAFILGDLVAGLALPIYLGAGAATLILVFSLLMRDYFGKLMAVYGVLAYRETGDPKIDGPAKNDRFNATFAKAWTLHVYYGNE